MNVFQKIKSVLILREAIIRADKAHEESGNRYYVMPLQHTRKLIIMDRFNFRKMKQKGYIPQNVFVHDLERECFYFTPYKDRSKKIDNDLVAHKRKEYFKWYQSCVTRKSQKDGKQKK